MERISRSPSFDSVSLVSGVSITKKKKTKRGKGKDNDDASLIGGAAKSAVSAGSTRGKGRTSKEREEEEEEEDTGGADLAADMVVQTQEEKRKEQIKRAMLIQAFDDEQSDRHLAWLSSKLPDATVRRVSSR
jgi:transcription initiation factor TFIID subunit 11